MEGSAPLFVVPSHLIHGAHPSSVDIGHEVLHQKPVVICFVVATNIDETILHRVPSTSSLLFVGP